MYPHEKKNDKAPNLKGKIYIAPELAGMEIEIAGWSQISKAGVKYISIMVSPPYVKKQDSQVNTPPPAPTSSSNDFDDDIPF